MAHATAPGGGQRLTGSDRFARAVSALQHGAQLRIVCALLTAEGSGDELAEVVVALAVRGKVAPQVAACGLVHVGNLLQQRIALGHDALEVVSALAAAIGLLPSLFEIIRPDGGVRPDVAVSRDLTRVKEVVEHAELQREFVDVGRSRRAVHGQARVAVAYVLAVRLQIAENLVEGAVLFDDVDDVPDGILSTSKLNLLGGRFHAVRSEHIIGPFVQMRVDCMFVDGG